MVGKHDLPCKFTIMNCVIANYAMINSLTFMVIMRSEQSSFLCMDIRYLITRGITLSWLSFTQKFSILRLALCNINCNCNIT